MTSSHSMSTARTVLRSPGSPIAGRRRASTRRSPCGTRTCRRASTFSRRGRRCRRTACTTTHSKWSGSSSSDICSRTRRSAGICAKARKAFSSPKRDSRAGASGAGWTCRRFRRNESRSTLMTTSLKLPRSDGTLHSHTLQQPRAWPMPSPGAKLSRIAYAAAHVVADPFASVDPWLGPAIDWDATLAFRSHLWSLGLGIAEAMDTAQRGMGLDWPTSLELIDRSLELARATPGGVIACGAGTDHLEPLPTTTLDDVIAAYRLQCEAIESRGGRIILMA